MSQYFERDTALSITNKLEKAVDEHGVFVLTGSYSIDALTGGDVAHNDIDANVFVQGALMKNVGLVDRAITESFALLDKTLEREDRLEYEIQSDERRETVELQFLEYEGYEQKNNVGLLTLPGLNEAGNVIQVPLINAELINSEGISYEFKVKSLEYAIATWAIRISGIINYQKRPVRKTDIDHFTLLLNRPFDNDGVEDAIAHHPQMIAVRSVVVLDKAKEIIGY